MIPKDEVKHLRKSIEGNGVIVLIRSSLIALTATLVPILNILGSNLIMGVGWTITLKTQ